MFGISEMGEETEWTTRSDEVVAFYAMNAPFLALDLNMSPDIRHGKLNLMERQLSFICLLETLNVMDG